MARIYRIKQFLLVLWVLVSPTLADEEVDKLESIRKEAKKSDAIFEALTASYRSTKTVSPKLVEEAERKDSILSVKKTTVEGIWFRNRYSTKTVSHSRMGDGSKSVRTNLFAFNGTKTYQNQNYKDGVIVIAHVPDNLVNPRFVAAPLHLGRMGTLEQIVDFKLANAPWGSAPKHFKGFQYRYLGKEKVGSLKCHKIKLSRLNHNPPQQELQRYVLWIAPEKNWQIAASRFYHLQVQEEPMSMAKVLAWKELKSGIWIPSRAETRHFTADKAGRIIESIKEDYELTSCELKCDPNDKRFNDVDFRSDMEIQVLDPKRNTARKLEVK